MNTLPLLTRATDDGVTFAMTPRTLLRTGAPRPIVETEPATTPLLDSESRLAARYTATSTSPL
jgi:hypothetical protein